MQDIKPKGKAEKIKNYINMPEQSPEVQSELQPTEEQTLEPKIPWFKNKKIIIPIIIITVVIGIILLVYLVLSSMRQDSQNASKLKNLQKQVGQGGACLDHPDCFDDYICFYGRAYDCITNNERHNCQEIFGDNLCHRKCLNNTDCSADMPSCKEVSTFISDTEFQLRFCVNEKAENGFTEGWKTYHNEQYNYELEYPGMWLYSQNEDGGFLEFNGKTIVITHDDNSNNLGIKDWLKHTDYVLQSGDDLKESVTEQGYKIYDIGELSNGNGGPNYKTFLLKDNHVFNFFLNTNFQHGLYERQVYDHMLSTFKIEDFSTWQTYKNEKYGFEFRYPEKWELVESHFDKRHDIQVFYEINNKTGIDFFITIEPNEDGLDEKQLREKNKQSYVEYSRIIQTGMGNAIEGPIAGGRSESLIIPTEEYLFEINYQVFRKDIGYTGKEVNDKFHKFISTFKFLDENVFDVNKVKEGDIVAGMKVVSVKPYRSDMTALGREQNLIIEFSGQAILEGEYEFIPEGSMPSGVLFSVIGEELSKLPLPLGNKSGKFMFYFTNQDFAKEQFGSSVTLGKATIVIDNFIYKTYPTGLNHEAKLVKVK